MTDDTALAAPARLAAWRDDPALFARECMGMEPDAWQLGPLRDIAARQRVAMQASKGVGKSAVEAAMLWWFMTTRPHANVIATSFSAENLRDGLWKEAALWQSRSPVLSAAFDMNSERITARGHAATWFASARTWAKSANATSQASALAGVHAENVLFLLDEVGDYPDAVVATAEAALAGEGGTKRLVIAGNPTQVAGPLWRAATTERPLWALTVVNGDPDDPGRSPRVPVEWARQQIEKYGRDNPWVLVNVFGRFPPASANSLLGPDDVREAMRRRVEDADVAHAQRRVGVDVARFGDDRTVIFARRGLRALAPVEMRSAPSHDVAARVALARERWGTEAEFVDDTGGYGSGVVDALSMTGRPAVPVYFSGKADDPRYYNKRTEMWFRMAEWVKRGGSLPDDPELAAELVAPTYTFRQGRLFLEEKDHVKERLGRSPDKADALALTFAVVDTPSGTPLAAALSQAGKAAHEYDPLER